ncbi:isochorismatase family protein [Rhizomonospora bruguierae]|uniref:isochorismatase family protein n=1 Tax=Rhizomonospora bruguierae TaxID=1581705 RepID=UPI001BCF0BD7|nr:isochorismatase family protein [Micromonospora sp. NBRC 107566]
MTIALDAGAALLVIDVQAAFDDESYWGKRNNPEAEANIAALAAAWSAAGRPVVRVRHASTNPASPLRPEHPGHAYKAVVAGLSPALEVVKSVHSAFHGTPDLGAWLTANGVRQVVVTGVQTNRCCETTARLAGDLGYDVLFALDATYTFTEGDVTADQFAAVTAANIEGNFGRVVSAADLL